MTLRSGKSHLLAQSVDNLGYVTRPGLFEVASKNTNAVAKAKLACTGTEARSVLGLCSVYRRFVKKFPTVVALLTELISKTYTPALLSLTEQQLIEFEELKLWLTLPEILHLPRANVPTPSIPTLVPARLAVYSCKSIKRRGNPLEIGIPRLRAQRAIIPQQEEKA